MLILKMFTFLLHVVTFAQYIFSYCLSLHKIWFLKQNHAKCSI